MLYQTSATASAGRQGHVATDDQLLSVDLAYPKQMGGAGNATNPEQLFAAGWAACFSNAVLFIVSQLKIKLCQTPVTANVGLYNKEDGGFALNVALAVELDLPQQQASDWSPPRIKFAQTPMQSKAISSWRLPSTVSRCKQLTCDALIY